MRVLLVYRKFLPDHCVLRRLLETVSRQRQGSFDVGMSRNLVQVFSYRLDGRPAVNMTI